MDEVVFGKLGVSMFEKLHFDAVDEKLEGSFGHSDDGFRACAELLRQGGGLEVGGRKKVEIDREPVSEAECEGRSAGQREACGRGF